MVIELKSEQLRVQFNSLVESFFYKRCWGSWVFGKGMLIGGQAPVLFPFVVHWEEYTLYRW